MSMISIYLDDKRETPEGFIRTYTVEETIALIQFNNGNIAHVSLDNDLGEGLLEGREVMKWIEEEAFHGTLHPIRELTVHSGNNVAVDEMITAANNAYKFWHKNIQDEKNR